jgi:hypothetical protein
MDEHSEASFTDQYSSWLNRIPMTSILHIGSRTVDIEIDLFGLLSDDPKAPGETFCPDSLERCNYVDDSCG